MTADSTVKLSLFDNCNFALIRLGVPGERPITLTETRLMSLKRALEEVKEKGARGLVIAGTAEDMFSVGADVSVIQGVTDPEVGADLARKGQEIFDLLESLNCITVAAISGPCVGGGCELVLACKYRILSDHKSSLIGLPETRLGILPGFGGTQRLPRLVGLPKGLDIILGGKTLRAKQALKAGLVDEVVPYAELEKRAEEIARGKAKPKRKAPGLLDKLFTWNPIGRAIVKSKAPKGVRKQTKGFYPAPETALNVSVSGLGIGKKRGLELEAKELGKLIVTPECKSLVHIFFLTENAKGIGKANRKDVEGWQTSVIGAGIMGAGIGGTFARNDHRVVIKDTSEEALKRGKEHIIKEVSKLRHLSSAERAALLSRIEYAAWNSQSIRRSDIVVEAVFENMELKKQLLSSMAKEVTPECILATNTSSLSVTEIAAGVPNQARVVGMHFFNPVEKMPLVEIIRGKETSDTTISLVAALTTKIGKFPIVVKDVPGFLVNRILVPYLNEAAFLLGDGIPAEEIDAAALAFGMPMGPVRLLDEVGLDVASHVSEVMISGYGERMRAPEFSKALVAAGLKGRKSGAGFYLYEGKESRINPKLQGLLNLPAAPKVKLSKEEITDRLILNLVNEAYKCLDEEVAGSGEHALSQIDLGTVMGIGFPPFRGGVMHYSRQRGLEDIKAKIKHYHEAFGLRYEPAPGLR